MHLALYYHIILHIRLLYQFKLWQVGIITSNLFLIIHKHFDNIYHLFIQNYAMIYVFWIWCYTINRDQLFNQISLFDFISQRHIFRVLWCYMWWVYVNWWWGIFHVFLSHILIFPSPISLNCRRLSGCCSCHHHHCFRQPHVFTLLCLLW